MQAVFSVIFHEQFKVFKNFDKSTFPLKHTEFLDHANNFARGVQLKF